MNNTNMQVFLLYFSGESHNEISNKLDITPTQINYILNTYGREWVQRHLKQEYKDKLFYLSRAGFNGQQIADQMGAPWNRWLVLWTMRRIDSVQRVELTPTANLNLAKLNFRCPICHSLFQMNLIEISSNPDRLCLDTTERKGCRDRRVTDRRSNKDRRNESWGTNRPIEDARKGERRSGVRRPEPPLPPYSFS